MAFTLSSLPKIESVGTDTRFIVTEGGVEGYVLASDISVSAEQTNPEVSGSTYTDKTVLANVDASLSIPISGYRAFVLSPITTNLTLNLPTLGGEDGQRDYVITLDVRQDNIGGHNLSFIGVSRWYNVNPFNPSNPPDMRFDTTPNSYGLFTFRSVDGYWFGNYGRAVI